MNQTHKRPREDAAKKRREYLWNTTKNNAIAMTSILAAVCLGFLSVAFFIGLLLSIGMLSFGMLHDAEYRTVGLIGVAFCGFGAFITGWISYYCAMTAKSTPCPPYVPPVAEQIAALPADEVLLRGSDQPEATPGELLRAAREGTETGPEELLRESAMPLTGMP
jgi:hypothetical protein